MTIRDGRVGGEGHSGEDFSVIGRDGSVHLPPEILGRFPAGTLLRVEEQPDGTILLVPAGVAGDAASPAARRPGSRHWPRRLAAQHGVPAAVSAGTGTSPVGDGVPEPPRTGEWPA